MPRVVPIGALVVLAGLSAPPAAFAMPTSLARPTRPALESQSLEAALPPGWHRRVDVGGLRADPHGLAVLEAANFRLPPTTAGCEQPIPLLSASQAVVRIWDYGPAAPGGGWRNTAALRLGPVAPTHDPLRRVRGAALARVRLGGTRLLVVASFGARRPAPAVRRAVAALLATVRV